MKCKVFNCASVNLEKEVNEWLSKERGLYILKVAPVGIRDGAGKVVVMIFYRQSQQVVQPEVPEEDLPHCPKCNRPMKVRANSNNGEFFFGCTAFPDCNGTRPFTEDDWHLFGGDPGPSDEAPIPF